MERLKSVALLAGLTALVLFIGQAMGGKSGFLMALVFAGVMNVGAYWFSDKIILWSNLIVLYKFVIYH